MNGLDLFSGIGGITLALEPWVQPVAYCENERYAQAVLLSRMQDGGLPVAPIWDDVRTLNGSDLPPVDIIYGGFPCQDISVAGRGAGMEQGDRSGLFFEILRLTQEIRPTFVFLENVPAIRTRGLSRVLSEFTALGYDSRWTVVSAADVGAPHLRKRWFFLAVHPERIKQWNEPGGRGRKSGASASVAGNYGAEEPLANPRSGRLCRSREREMELQGRAQTQCSGEALANPEYEGPGRGIALENSGESEGNVAHVDSIGGREGRPQSEIRERQPDPFCGNWWSAEPNLVRVAHGVPLRVDRLRGLGNAVVPLQARVAFERLMYT